MAMKPATFFVGSLLISCAGLLFAGCAPTPQKIELAKTKASCSGPGTGPSVAPLPTTREAMKADLDLKSMSLADLMERVGRGETTAQVELGVRYANGEGVEKNGERAVSLFQTAMARDNALATFYMGAAYSNGFGVAKDDMLASMYFEQAARQGLPVAQYFLALFIGGGRGGIMADWCASVPLLEAAALDGMEMAALQLGVIYGEGLLGAPDYEKAAYWYRSAMAGTRSFQSQYNLRSLIDRNLIEWKEGDPGKPPAKKDNNDGNRPRLKIKDGTVDSVG